MWFDLFKILMFEWRFLQTGSSMAKRFEVLDSWRGLAAMTVALSRLDTNGAIFASPLVQNSYLFVDFFFVLSGFVIAHAYGASLTTGRSFAAFALRRFGRLWPLHAFMFALFIAYEASRLMSSSANSAFPPFTGLRAPGTMLPELTFATTLGYGPTGWNDPSWSISAEFWTYLLFGALCLSFRRSLAAVSILVAAAAMVFVTAKSSSGMDVTFTYGLARCIAGFLIGTLVYGLWLRMSEARQTTAMGSGGWMTVSEIVGLAGALAFVWFAGRSPVSYAAPVVFGLLVLLFAHEGGAVSRLLRLRPFLHLGNLSYSIYMTALFVAMIAGRGLQTLGDRLGGPLRVSEGSVTASPAAYADVMSVIYLAAVVAFSVVTYRLVETPGRRYFNRLSLSVATLRPRQSRDVAKLIPGE